MADSAFKLRPANLSCLARLDGDLLRSSNCLSYMPWSRTPVVPTGLIVNIFRLGVAFAATYLLGHHELMSLTGLNPFTLEPSGFALRPA
jgi:hypothetical protein